MAKKRSFYRKWGKRALDICASLCGLILLSPVLLVTAILVRTKLGSPILFCQERPGKDGKIFKLYKFRTMTDAHDRNGNILSDEERLTPFGRMLRSTSLDELPELFNVLKGDMSLVGPRPLLVQYLPLYSKKQMRRHEVLPGITGLAQVNGRNTLSWQDKFEFDVEYVDTYSLALDFKILMQTITKVFKREGISSDSSATMEPFTGNDVEE